MSILLAVLGIGFLLFIHEAGHFLVARWCGVTVEVFSLGIGPRIGGFRRGDTDYRLSLFPIGGYVRMAGEDPGKPPLPGHLNAQPPAARLFIFSGGILANFLFALVSFPFLFHTGVSFGAPVLGRVDSGGPAWAAGLREGDRVLRVNGEKTLGFRHFSAAVGLSLPGETLEVAISREGSTPIHLGLTPSFNELAGMPRAGVGASLLPAIRPESPATQAGLEKNDVLLSLDGISLDSAIARRILLESLPENSNPVPARVRRGGVEMDFILNPEPFPEPPSRIGVWEVVDEIAAFHGEALGEFQVGDRILGPDRGEAKTPPTLRGMNDLLLLALQEGGLPPLVVERAGKRVTLAPLDASPDTIAASLHLQARTPFSLIVREGGPAWEAGLRAGDHPRVADGAPLGSFLDLAQAISSAAPEPVTLIVARPRVHQGLIVKVAPAHHPLWDHGLSFQALQERVKGDSFLQSCRMGIGEAWDMTTQVAGTLSSLFAGSVAPNQLGGIITIGVLTHGFAERGFIDFIFFLGLISVNLAFLNLLPIPVLDGGHIFLVVLEMLRGKPVPLRIQGAMQLVGALFLLGLLVFVTYNDIVRLASS